VNYFNKFLFFITACLCLAPFCALAQSSAINVSLKGNFDSVSCDSLTGWVCDANSYSTPLAISFYADGVIPGGKLIGSANANVTRGKAIADFCGGNANHGFLFSVPDTLKDGMPHKIYAYATNFSGGANLLLNANGKTITCSRCANECSKSGLMQCGGKGTQVCGDYDNDGCLEWSAIINCASGYICSNGICVNGTSAAVALVLSGLFPAGIVSGSSVLLAVNTNRTANCRYDIADKSFSAMANEFSTNNYMKHSAPVATVAGGRYTYYVRCRDAAGVVNTNAAIISFGKAGVAAAIPVADIVPPVISKLLPSVSVDKHQVTISCVTDEPAFCKYDIADVGYDSMKNLMDGSNGIHSAKVDLPNSGDQVFYVRCKDKAGNKNTQSARIDFNYSVKAVPPETTVEISNPLPAGKIYQEVVALAVVTDKPADCRYAPVNIDFDKMEGRFESVDGMSQKAIATLTDFGSYKYYVRCKDKTGGLGNSLAVIEFEYADPDRAVEREPDLPLVCDKYSLVKSDGKCNMKVDCVCDPDCGKNGKNIDPDCAKTDIKKAENNVNWTGVAVGLAVLVALTGIAVFVVKKRNGKVKNEDD